MTKKFLSTLKIVNLPSDPTAGSEGELYFNSSASVAKIYQAGAWSVLGAGAGGGTTVSTTEPVSPEIGDSWYKNDTGEFYVYDGTYWVEVNGTISLSQEQVQDYVAPMFTSASNTNVIATYDDINNVINLNTSGSLISVDSIRYPDFITFDTTPEIIPTEQGSIYWDSGDTGLRVLANNTSILLGQEQYATVKNATGSSIAKGKVVYINGAQGQRPTIALSDADTEPTSSKTFGITAEAIADGAEGVITTEGILRGINTDGLTEGGAIWLSSTAGNFTQTMPTQPVHGVFLGYVVKAHASSGEIYVKIQNGYELNELHNVLINGVNEDQVLRYDEVLGLWKNTHPNIITARNVTESTIPAFTPVYINTQEFDQDNITFAPADSASAMYLAKLPADAITTASVANNAYGKLVTMGVVEGVDLTGYSVGDLLYVAVGGGLTSVRPTGSNAIQPFARVISTDNGTIYVYGNTFVSSTENLPNLENNKIWLGTSGRPEQTTLNSSIVPENTNLYFTNERAQDAAAELFTSGVHTGASVEYNDSTGKLNITNTGVTALYGTSNEIEVSSNTGGVTIGIPDSPIFTTPNIGVATATSINGTSIPSSSTLVVSTDLSSYLTMSSASSTYLTQSSASSTYLTQTDASTTYQPIGSYLTSESDPVFVASESYNINSASTSAWNSAYGWGDHAAAGYLTSFTETDTLETVTDRGATSTNAISITNATAASSSTTGALIVSGGVGIGEDLYVNNNVYIGGDINITGSISGSLTYVNVTDLVVTDPLIYLAESNPNDSVDIGIFAALNHSSSAYYHTGLIRDASDSGKWKLASNLLDPTNNVIDFTSATFDTLKIGALEVTDASTTRTNIGLAIGTDVQAYNSTLAAVAGGTYSGDDSITTVGTISSGTWNGTAIGYAYGGTGLTTLGTAGQVLTVNAGATAIEWATPSGGGGGGLTTTTTSITTNSATAIESFAISTSRTAEAIIQITQGTDYYSSKALLIHDGTTVKITEYAILESTTGAIPVTISAAISGSNLELLATIADAASTNATAKVIFIEVGV